MRVPVPEDFRSRLRSPAVAARVGVWLGICFGICFLTGLLSHYAQNHSQPIPFPTSPSWGYRVTQGVHVLSGVASVPLLLVKLWTVYPRLFLRPPRDLRQRAVDLLERGSIAVLVASAVFQLATGLANVTRWYPWDFSFRSTHYALAWIAIGSLLVHIAVKLPITRDVLRGDVDSTAHDRDGATESGVLTRRGLLRTTWVAAGVAVLANAGASVPFLRDLSVFAVNSGSGPQGIPINKTAAEVDVTAAATSADYRLEVEYDGRITSLSREDLARMEQRTEDLPIACVEGWSAGGTWTGVRLRDLLDLVEAPRGHDVLVSSLQASGPFRVTTLQGNFADDDRTLLALGLDGEPLALDHGYPCRLIAPNRPGVLQTKWVGRVEVVA
jgi:hypothetical protein